MKKKLCLIFCIVSCILMMAGCSLSLTKTNKNFNKKTLETNADSFVTSGLVMILRVQLNL